MIRRKLASLWLCLFTLMLIAQPTSAQTDPIRSFPGVLVDAACTDDFDTPSVGTIANPQLTGSADGLCDGDTNILTGTLASDTDLGPIGSVEYQNGYLRIDADTVSGATPTWRICLKVYEPWSADTWSRTVECSSTISGVGSGDDYIGLGPMFLASEFDLAETIVHPLPQRFKITIDLLSATDWAGSIGFIHVRGAGVQPHRTTDAVSLAGVGITFAHHEVHEGDAFISDFVDASLADTETIIMAFKTMSDPVNAHLITGMTTKAGGNVELWEAATWTAETGTETEIINRKRKGTPGSSGLLADVSQASFVAADVIVTNPTGLNIGSATSVHHIYSWGIQGQGTPGGGRDLREFILKADTTYAAVFTAIGGTNAGQIILNWYEHLDKSQ